MTNRCSLHWIFVSICLFSLALVWLCEILLRCFISRWQGPAIRYWVTVAYYRPCRVSWNHGSLLLASQPILTYGYCELLWGRLVLSCWATAVGALSSELPFTELRNIDIDPFHSPPPFWGSSVLFLAINSRVFRWKSDWQGIILWLVNPVWAKWRGFTRRHVFVICIFKWPT